jgi:hypothetical protein
MFAEVPDVPEQPRLSIEIDNLGVTVMWPKDDEAWRLSRLAERNVQQGPFDPE